MAQNREYIEQAPVSTVAGFRAAWPVKLSTRAKVLDTAAAEMLPGAESLTTR